MDTEVKISFYNHIYHLAERSYYETFLPLDKISEPKKYFVNYMMNLRVLKLLFPNFYRLRDNKYNKNEVWQSVAKNTPQGSHNDIKD